MTSSITFPRTKYGDFNTLYFDMAKAGIDHNVKHRIATDQQVLSLMRAKERELQFVHFTSQKNHWGPVRHIITADAAYALFNNGAFARIAYT